MRYSKIAVREHEEKKLAEAIKRGEYDWLDDLTLLLDEPEPLGKED